MGKVKLKARYWQAIAYNENLVDNWQEVISEKFQVPFAYCIHDKDVDKANNHRKTHTHIILAFGNTTTENFALQVFKSIEKEGCSAYPNDIIQQVFDIRNAYDYLTHNTDDAKKKNKYQYDRKELICGNGFDIGNYEQLGKADKNRMIKELADIIIKNNYSNYTDFYMDIVSNFDDTYYDILISHTSVFRELTKGNYLKEKAKRGDNY